ncbi:formate--tetrahydrofolate ligase, partial [Aerococcus mictus]
LEAVRKGFANLGRHIQIMKSYQVPVLVAINHFKDDRDEEIELIKELCHKEETPSYLADVWEKGGQGALDLGQAVIDSVDGEENTTFQTLYQADQMNIEEKIQVINQKIYG